ncbi:MAG TPA: hypothetical protein VNC78_07590 [Actinomycetota bacterium]|nr:hypothetical protein [Actinomycetota bacterium]
MHVRTILLLAAAVTSGCTSGVAPGSGSVTNQIDRALAVQVDVSLRQAAVAQEAVMATTGSYTTDIETLGANGMNVAADVTVTIASADAVGYCINGTHNRSDGVRHIDETGTLADGACN